MNQLQKLIGGEGDSSQREIFYRQSGELKWFNFGIEASQTALKIACTRLENLDIKPHSERTQRVALLLENGPLWEIFERAAWQLGLSCGGIELQTELDQMARRLMQANPAAVVTRRSYFKDKGFEQLNLSTEWIFLEDIGLGDLSILKATPEKGPHWRDVSIEAEAVWLFTSGTTGEPKLITYTQRQVLIAVQGVLSHFGPLKSFDRSLIWLPLANLFSRILNRCAWVAGVGTYYLDDPREVAEGLKKAKPTILIGVPRFFEKLSSQVRSQLRFAPRFMRYWALRRILGGEVRMLISGSAACPSWVLEFFRNAKVPILEAYGVSESLLPIAANAPTKCRDGSVGQILQGQEIHIAEDGEIEIRSETGFLEHAPKQDNMKPQFHRTGDVGQLDQDGFLFISGRKNDFIKTAQGRKVAPLSLESDLKASGLFGEAIVLGNNLSFLYAAVFPTTTSPREIRKAIESYNVSHPRGVGLKMVAILKSQFKPGGEFLTTNLKVRRGRLENLLQPKVLELDCLSAKVTPWQIYPVPEDTLLSGWMLCG